MVKFKKSLQWNDHTEWVGALSIIDNYLVSGSRDKKILLYDIRVPKSPIKIYNHHQQEVCGLSWSPNKEYFASGGNDNKMFVYSPKVDFPVFKKSHKAAVKAIAWSNWRVGVFATGGGTADWRIRIWSLSKKELLIEKDSGS